MNWSRPHIPPIDVSTQSLAVMCLEVDSDQSLIRLYGVTDGGCSVLINVHGFESYFYVDTPSDFIDEDIYPFTDHLESNLRSCQRYQSRKRQVLDVERITSQTIWGYQNDHQSNFLRIELSSPFSMYKCREYLNSPMCNNGKMQHFNTYESNIPYILRFMIDTNLSGVSWIELPAGKYEFVEEPYNNVQMEINISYDDIITHQPVNEWLKVAPLRILSFDIECAGRKGKFPEPEIDSVIQIANCVTVQGDDKPIIMNVFTLNTCAPLTTSTPVEATVHSYDTEVELLSGWRDFMIASDPDVITGYNTKGFDFPYLIKRAETIGCDAFAYLGRLANEKTVLKTSRFSSRAYGTRDNEDANISGRVQFDILPILRRDYKLSSYTLNNVSHHFLKQQKEDVHHSIITDLQNGDCQTRRRLAEYCLKDALLPQRLIDKLLLLVNNIEMSRVTGVPLTYLMTRGQQIKVMSQIYRKTKQRNMLIPNNEHMTYDDTFQGATVIQPKRGYYDETVATLDFASLYPSIMMAHNLCYSTIVHNPDELKQMNADDYTKTPFATFVKSNVKRGILPEILDELLTARRNARKELEKATDPLLRSVLNGRQLALKISANSIYGVTGCSTGQLPCLAISSSVTDFGRQMIETTSRVVESHYCKANGYEHDADVIYGDTDSVMVRFGTKSVAEAIKIGTEAAILVTKEFIPPIKLEFEKVFYPYLLMNKKRYAGLYWTNSKKWDRLDTKGIETVRRDNCLLVREMVGECLNRILINHDPQGALEYAKSMISDLLCNKLDLSLLVITKSLGRTDYVNKQAHVELSKRMHKRDPGNAPCTGDRIAYVMKQMSKKTPAYDRTEDPIYVLENDIPIDTRYYLEHQLAKPLTRIFEPILGSKIESLLNGAHTQKISIQVPKTGALMKFMVKRNSCLKCKTSMPKDNQKGALCKYCIDSKDEMAANEKIVVDDLENVHESLLQKCRDCQGSQDREVTCISRDCITFYQRFKANKDLSLARIRLERYEH